ncbi:M16 family metallopeptidase [Pedobacter miscanthi]|uniref:M16 family metallopeptidase n=1 Tax=Pedobacter miscanthi TaxID=2259170 RepID=UPI0029307026|nr:insulinase family protein [Pedobacter miscanthi]
MKIYRTFKRQELLTILLLWAGGLSSFAQTGPMQLDPAVRTGKLANGFTYYIRHNTEPKNRAVFYLANKVGSILETEQQRGLAHFLEHMSFNGTAHFPKNRLIDYLQKAGVRFGADINAYTSFDETVYQLPLPTDDPEIVKNGLQILRDWAQDLTLETSEIDKERGVILEEKRLGKGAKERMQNEYFPKLLNGSKYASRMPIGTDEVLKTFSPDTLRSFYKDWYRPDLQAVIIVGDIDVDAMEREIRAKFSDLKNPIHEKQRIKYSGTLSGKNQVIAVSDKEMTATIVQVMVKHTASELKTAEDFRLSIGRSLVNQMLAGRYNELSRKPEPEFLQGSASIGPLFAGFDVFAVNVISKPGRDNLEKGFKSVWRESLRAKKFGFTQGELSRAKMNYNSRIEAVYKEKDKMPSQSYVDAYLQHFLKGQATPGLEAENRLIKELLPGISLQELNSLAKNYIKDTDRDILIMSPDKDKTEVPDEATLNQWIASVESETLTPYTEEANSKSLLAGKRTGGKIISEKKDIKMGITSLKLSNGVSIVLKPTQYKTNEISFSGFSSGGSSLYPDADYQSAANSSALINGFGVGNYNATDLGRFLTGRNLSVRTGISERNQTVTGYAVPQDLPMAMELLYGYFTEPRKDRAQFESIITRSKASLANRGDDPGSVFQDTISAVMGGNNIRRTGPSIAKIEQINLDRAYEIYKERFADAGGFTFTFVGSFNVDSIKPLLAEYLGALPSTNKTVRAKDLNIAIPSGQISKTVYKGSEPKATVELIFSGPYEYNLKNNISLSALKEVLSIRLTERLREEEGGVYSPSASYSVGKFPKPTYTFGISFGCSPENVDKLIASALDEVKKLRTEGPPIVNVEKFVAEERRQWETSVNTNSYWLNYLTNCLQTGENFDVNNSYSSLLGKITPDNIKATANKYLSGDNLIKFILLPSVNSGK